MSEFSIVRGAAVALPFSITDTGNSLADKRVTWSVGGAVAGVAARVLKKASARPGTTAEITIDLQNPGTITGKINLTPADFALLPKGRYCASLWIDDGAGGDRCVTPGGADVLTIVYAIQRD